MTQCVGRFADRLGRLLKIPLNEWPAGLGLHIPAEFDPSRSTVLLIHGLGSGIAALLPMQAAFERWGVQVLTFDFPNDGPIAWSGDRLSTDLGKLVQQYPTVHLVDTVAFAADGEHCHHRVSGFAPDRSRDRCRAGRTGGRSSTGVARRQALSRGGAAP